ncbi:MAG: spore maturation protein [Firmicutes bacterium]|nr:spore maturation protein [Bacillota bacterium]
MFFKTIESVSAWIIPAFLILTICYGLRGRINLFEVFIEGAREGFPMAIRLVPYLVGMLVAIGLLRDSGAMDLLARLLAPLLNLLNIPVDIIPLVLMRPVSGSGALAVTTEILQIHGPDSFLGRLASTMQGSTDTTLFVLTVYFGAVGISRSRHALAAGLLGDMGGFIASIIVCKIFFS